MNIVQIFFGAYNSAKTFIFKPTPTLVRFPYYVLSFTSNLCQQYMQVSLNAYNA